MTDDAVIIPRCSHGNIILGCPDDDCPEQSAYLQVMNTRYTEFYKQLLPSSLQEEPMAEMDPWTPYMRKEDDLCGCWTCVNERAEKIEDSYTRLTYLSRFIVCPDCGNKRCPKATSHENACTGSNEPGQPGSRYESLG